MLLSVGKSRFGRTTTTHRLANHLQNGRSKLRSGGGGGGGGGGWGRGVGGQVT